MRKPRFTATQIISALNEVEGSKAVNWNSLRFGETSKLPGFSVRTPPESSLRNFMKKTVTTKSPSVPTRPASFPLKRSTRYDRRCRRFWKIRSFRAASATTRSRTYTAWRSTRSAVDVLMGTGDHTTFLDLFSRYDPKGFAILSNTELADKTVWAPTDAAFLAIRGDLSTLSHEEIAAILGYHVSPPRRAPGGSYPIATPEFLINAEQMNHRTRTGVLTTSDQRTRTSVTDGVLMIENARILGTAWCAEAGSVFSIDTVIMDVTPPSAPVWTVHRIVRMLLYDDIRFVIYSTVGSTVGVALIGHFIRILIKRRKNAQAG